MNYLEPNLVNPVYKSASLRCVLPPASGNIGLAFDVEGEAIRISLPLSQLLDACRIASEYSRSAVRGDLSAGDEIGSSIVVAGEWSTEIKDPEFQIVLKYWEGLTPRRILTPEEVELLIGRSLRCGS